MDEKLILSVFNYPELYNVTMPDYRCTDSRASAWRNISLAVDLPCEFYLILFLFSFSYRNFKILFVYLSDIVQLRCL